MKLRITTILSLAGVLSAGSAAALVNNQVLQTTSANSNSGIAIDAAGTAANSATRIYSAALTATQLSYQVGNAGVVTIDTAGGVLSVVSATADPGWVVVKSESDGSAAAQVQFQSADDLVQFTANRLDDGSVVTAVESSNASGDTGNTVTGNAAVTDDSGVDANSGTGDNSGHGHVDNCDDAGVIKVCVDASADAEVNDD